MPKRKQVTIQLSALLAYLSAISAIAPECIVNISEKMLQSRVVDFANVAMVIAGVKVTQGNLEAKIGINVSEMKNALVAISKMVPVETPLSIRIREDKDQERPLLEIEVPGKFRQYLLIRTVDKRTIRREPNRPTIVLPVRADIEGQDLLNAILACSLHSDIVRIAVDQEGICAVTSKGENQQHKIEVATGGAGVAASLYSIDYLKDIVKALSSSKCVLHFQNDHPLDIAGTLDNGVSVRYLLAPRMEEDAEVKWL